MLGNTPTMLAVLHVNKQNCAPNVMFHRSCCRETIDRYAHHGRRQQSIRLMNSAAIPERGIVTSITTPFMIRGEIALLPMYFFFAGKPYKKFAASQQTNQHFELFKFYLGVQEAAEYQGETASLSRICSCVVGVSIRGWLTRNKLYAQEFHRPEQKVRRVVGQQVD